MNRIVKGIALFAISMFIINTNVSAENYKSFKKGDFVELYYSEENKELGNSKKDETRYNIIIEEDQKEKEYVKTLSLGVGKLGNGYSETEGINFSPDTFFDLTGPTPLHTIVNKLKEDGFQDYIDQNNNGPFFKDFSEKNSVGFISLEELIDVFGAEDNNQDGIYTIDINKKISSNGSDIKTIFKYLATEIKKEADKSNKEISDAYGIDWELFKSGFYTSTLKGNQIYVVNFKYDENKELNGINVYLDDLPETNPENIVFYALVPTLYYHKELDEKKEIIDENNNEKNDETIDEKNNDIKEDENKEEIQVDPKTDDEYACYLCNDEYIWKTENNECKLIKDINSKSKCVKPVETGLKEYVVELILGIIISLGIYNLIKKYNLFKKI